MSAAQDHAGGIDFSHAAGGSVVIVTLSSNCRNGVKEGQVITQQGPERALLRIV
ncbi:MAG: hypothetical protein M0P52_11170 [Rhodoferax sp.]|nr:hypothetical protein [Rhodoferax sp.]